MFILSLRLPPPVGGIPTSPARFLRAAQPGAALTDGPGGNRRAVRRLSRADAR
jgi:hypothetical protein